MKALVVKQPTKVSANRKRHGDRVRSPLAVGEARLLSSGLAGSAMLQRKPGCACGGNCPRCQEKALLQTKLKISEPGDPYEQEADRLADQVTAMPEPIIRPQVTPETQEILQRQPVEEEEEEETSLTNGLAEQISPLIQKQAEPMEEDTIQTKSNSGQPSTVSFGAQKHATTLRGGGQVLPQSQRAFFEPRFGYDFSGVRIHTDTKADQLNRQLDARAFTVAQNIFFRSGEYEPGNLMAQKLLAHELAHVVQQSDKRFMLQCSLEHYERNENDLEIFLAQRKRIEKWLHKESDPFPFERFADQKDFVEGIIRDLAGFLAGIRTRLYLGNRIESTRFLDFKSKIAGHSACKKMLSLSLFIQAYEKDHYEHNLWINTTLWFNRMFLPKFPMLFDIFEHCLSLKGEETTVFTKNPAEYNLNYPKTRELKRELE